MNTITRLTTRPLLPLAPVRAFSAWAFSLLLATAAVPLRADQVEMQNGDRYVGHVVSLNDGMLVLQNENLGKIMLPRVRIATITLRATASASKQTAPSASNNSTPLASAPAMTAAPAPPAAANTGTTPSPGSPLSGLAGNTNLVEQVRGQFLSGAGGAANGKFDELLTGLTTGKMNIDDLRAQAKASADQLRALKRESGGTADPTLDVYLDILDNFLKEAGQPSNLALSTNTPGKN